MNFGVVVLFVIVAIIIPVAFAVIAGMSMYARAKRTYRRFFGNTSVTELINSREQEIENTPKSVAGMEPLERPKIQRDFPDMSIDELKSRDIDEIYAYYNALKIGNIARYNEMHLFNDQMKSAIDSALRQGYSISDINIHRQSISRYTKTEKTATINIQTAFEGLKSTKGLTDGKKTQLRVETQWVYLLDTDNFDSSLTTTLNCPNCGAPVADLAGKFCEHCGSEVTIDYGRSWHLSYLKEC